MAEQRIDLLRCDSLFIFNFQELETTKLKGIFSCQSLNSQIPVSGLSKAGVPPLSAHHVFPTFLPLHMKSSSSKDHLANYTFLSPSLLPLWNFPEPVQLAASFTQLELIVVVWYFYRVQHNKPNFKLFLSFSHSTSLIPHVTSCSLSVFY